MAGDKYGIAMGVISSSANIIAREAYKEESWADINANADWTQELQNCNGCRLPLSISKGDSNQNFQDGRSSCVARLRSPRDYLSFG